MKTKIISNSPWFFLKNIVVQILSSFYDISVVSSLVANFTVNSLFSSISGNTGDNCLTCLASCFFQKFSYVLSLTSIVNNP